jgi:hypothetical protein
MPDVVQSARESLREEDIQGLKYFRKLWPLFERLRDVGCKREGRQSSAPLGPILLSGAAISL